MHQSKSDSVQGVFAEARTKVTNPFALLLEAAGSVAGVGIAAQQFGTGSTAIIVGLVLGAVSGWVLTYLMNVALVWFGTIRRLRVALDRCLGEKSSRWDDEFKEFRRLAFEAWEGLDMGFVEKGFFGLSAGVDSLKPLVTDAPWPDADESDQPDHEMIAEGALRDFAKRLYVKDASSVFTSGDDLFHWERIRMELAFLVGRWGRELEAGDEMAGLLGREMRKSLGRTNLQSIKLLWYVEEAKAATIPDHVPDFRPWALVRGALSMEG